MEQSQDTGYNGVESSQDLSKLSYQELLERKDEALENDDWETLLKIVKEMTRRDEKFAQGKARREIANALRFKDNASKLENLRELWMSHGATVYQAAYSWDIVIDMNHKLKDNLERISDMELNEWVILYLWSNEIWDEWAKWISKIKLNKWCYLSLYMNKIWAEWAKAIAENLKLEEWVTLILTYNEIWAEWAKAISKMKLKKNVRLDLCGNEIWAEWAKAISMMELKENVSLDLSCNKIWDEWAKAISKMKLKKNVRLDLSDNEIWNEWADAIMKNLDMKDWVELILWYNNMTEWKEEELKSWAKSYEEKWIKCKVSFSDEEEDE